MRNELENTDISASCSRATAGACFKGPQMLLEPLRAVLAHHVAARHF